MTNEKITKAMGLEEEDIATIMKCLDFYIGVNQNNAMEAVEENNHYVFEWYKRELEKVRKLRDKIREALEVEG